MMKAAMPTSRRRVVGRDARSDLTDTSAWGGGRGRVG